MTTDQIRKKASTDFYFFCKHVLGYDRMVPVPHRELCDFIVAEEKNKKLVLMPRGSFKSSVANVGGCLWLMLHDPNTRILIASETQKNAKKYFQEIKAHIESNQKFRALFGDWSAGSKRWRDDEIIIAKRNKIKKEPTIMYASLEKQALTGMHFDHIILDDVVSQHNVNNTDQIEKTINYYRYLLSILDPEARMKVIGTRYSAIDLHGWLQEPSNGELEQFDVIVKSALDENGNPTMPSILSKEFLDRQRKAQGSYIFSCQYLNDAVNAENTFFRQEHIRYYDTAPEGLMKFITIDPAISTKARSDFTGIIVNGVDSLNNWYILEALEVKVEPSDLIDLILELCERYATIQCIGMEEFMLEKFLKPSLFAEMDRRGTFIPINSVPTNTQYSKEARIRGLQPKFEAQEIHLKNDMIALRHQIIYYPQVKNDDLIDALKSQLAITYPANPLPQDEDMKLDHLSRNEKRIWKHVQNIGKRKVKVRKHW